MDDIEVRDIKRFEKELLEYIDVNDKSLFDEIRKSGVLSDTTIDNMKKIISEFQSKFKRS